jgi:hypothetical protein
MPHPKQTTRNHASRPFDGYLDPPLKWCRWPRCQNRTGVLYAPLCMDHLAEAYRIWRDAHAWLIDGTLERAHEPREPLPPLSERPGVIYFARFGDKVKIGFTTNLRGRLDAIPHDEILGTAPGMLADEKRCHAAFAHLREQGEWFRAEPDLLAFIKDVTAQGA